MQLFVLLGVFKPFRQQNSRSTATRGLERRLTGYLRHSHFEIGFSIFAKSSSTFETCKPRLDAFSGLAKHDAENGRHRFLEGSCQDRLIAWWGKSQAQPYPNLKSFL